MLALIASAPASAQTAEAESLFRQGKALMKDGKTAEACEKFDASERIEPAAGTELNLADCREKNGQTATAWAMFLKAGASARHEGDDDKATEAKARAKTVEADLVYLTIHVPEEADLDGLVIKRNDTVIDRALWDQKVPVDPDEYTITARAPGRKTWTDSIVVKTKNKTIDVPRLDKDRKHKDTIEPRPAGRVPDHTAALAMALTGTGALVAGTGLAWYASSVEDQADAVCPGIKCADAHAVSLNQTAHTDALIADALWGIGGAALVTAAILWYVEGPPPSDVISVAPLVGAGHAGLAIGGRF